MSATDISLLLISALVGVIVLVGMILFVRRKRTPKISRTEESKTEFTEKQEERES